MTFERLGLSPREAAELLGCHEDTVKRWAKTGRIPAFRTPAGWWRFRRQDIEALVDMHPSEGKAPA